MAPQDRAQTNDLSRPGAAEVRVGSGFRDRAFNARAGRTQIGAADFASLSRKFRGIAAAEIVEDHNDEFDAGYQEVLQATEAEYRAMVKKEREAVSNGVDPVATTGRAMGARRARAERGARDAERAARTAYEAARAEAEADAQLGKTVTLAGPEEFLNAAYDSVLKEEPHAEDFYYRRHFGNARIALEDKFYEDYRKDHNNLSDLSYRVNTYSEGVDLFTKIALEADVTERARLTGEMYHWAEEALRKGNIPKPAEAYVEMLGTSLDGLRTRGRDMGLEEEVIDAQQQALMDEFQDKSVGTLRLDRLPAFMELHGRVFSQSQASERTEGKRLQEKRQDRLLAWEIESTYFQQIKKMTADEIRIELVDLESGASPHVLDDEQLGLVYAQLKIEESREDLLDKGPEKLYDAGLELLNGGDVAGARLYAGQLESVDPALAAKLSRAVEGTGAAEWEGFVASKSYTTPASRVTSRLSTLDGLQGVGKELQDELLQDFYDLQDDTRRSFAGAEGDFTQLTEGANTALTQFAEEVETRVSEFEVGREEFMAQVVGAVERLDAAVFETDAAKMYMSPQARAEGRAGVRSAINRVESPLTHQSYNHAAREFELLATAHHPSLLDFGEDANGVPTREVSAQASVAFKREYDKLANALAATDEWRSRVAGLTDAEATIELQKEMPALITQALNNIKSDGVADAAEQAEEEERAAEVLRNAPTSDFSGNPEMLANYRQSQRDRELLNRTARRLGENVDMRHVFLPDANRNIGTFVTREGDTHVTGRMLDHMHDADAIYANLRGSGQHTNLLFPRSPSLDAIIASMDGGYLPPGGRPGIDERAAHPAGLLAMLYQVRGKPVQTEAVLAVTESVRSAAMAHASALASSGKLPASEAEAALSTLARLTWLTPEEARAGAFSSGTPITDWRMLVPETTKHLQEPEHFNPDYAKKYFEEVIEVHFPGDYTLDSFLDTQYAKQ